MSPTCTHIAIHARDIDRSVLFYQRYAGLTVIHRRAESRTTVVWLAEPERGAAGVVIVLLGMSHAEPADPPPLAHIGYAVASRSEVDRIAAMAREDGILVEPPRDAGPIVGYFCIVADPDGNRVEFSYGQKLGPTAGE